MRGFRLICALVGSGILLAACGGSSAPATGNSSNCVKAPTDLVTQGTVTFGSDLTYPPMEMVINNKQVGLDIDLGQALAAKMCIQASFLSQDFNAIIASLNAKKFDAILSSMAITPKRQEAIDFIPYITTGRVVITKKGSGIRITDLAQLCGHTLAVEAGTAEIDTIKAITCPSGKPINYTLYPTDTEAQQQLLLGRVELRLTSSLQGGYAVKQSSELELASPVLGGAIHAGIGVRKGDTTMTQALQGALSAIETDGTYGRILSAWGQSAGDIRTT